MAKKTLIFSFTIQFLNELSELVSRKTGEANLAFEGEAKVAGLQGTGTMRAGTEENNLQAAAEGSVLSAKANLSAGYFTGKNNKRGAIAAGGAEATLLKGEFNPSFSLFGYRLGAIVGGKLGGFAAGVGAGIYKDTGKGTCNLEFHIDAAFIVGPKLGVQISVPYLPKKALKKIMIGSCSHLRNF